MNWILFVRADCHDCDPVRAWMDERGIVYEVRDIDDPGSRLGKRLFIAPALCRGTELVAYGVDIIAYLERSPR